MTPQEALDKAIAHAGGLGKLAKLLKHRSSTRVCNWRTRGVPEDECADVEFAVKGAVTCEKLRPDVTWVRVADANWPHPKGCPARISPRKPQASARKRAIARQPEKLAA